MYSFATDAAEFALLLAFGLRRLLDAWTLTVTAGGLVSVDSSADQVAVQFDVQVAVVGTWLFNRRLRARNRTAIRPPRRSVRSRT